MANRISVGRLIGPCPHRFRCLLSNTPDGEIIHIDHISYAVFQVSLSINISISADLSCQAQKHTREGLLLVVIVRSSKCVCSTIMCFSLQMMMKSLYCGGTEGITVSYADAMKVRGACPPLRKYFSPQIADAVDL